MNRTINTPYVKQYDENGKVSNLIPAGYPTIGANRKQRRKYMQKANRVK